MKRLLSTSQRSLTGACVGIAFALSMTIPAVASSLAGPGSINVQSMVKHDGSNTLLWHASSHDPFVRAYSMVQRGQHAEALALKSRISDPAGRKLIDWQIVQLPSLIAGYEKIIAFLNENPSWPHRFVIERRAEEAMLKQNAPPGVVRDYFANREPRTTDGLLALARAALKSGEPDQARRWAGQAWRVGDFSQAEEQEFLRQYGSLIADSDNRRRLVRQIYERKGTAAERTAARISSDHARMAKAASALLSMSAAAPRLFNETPARFRDQLVMKYPLARFHRRNGDMEKARAITLTVPSDHELLDVPYTWWVERRLQAREALTPNNPSAWREAYRLASAHGYLSGPHFIEGEFLSGFIALRYLKDARAALPHFTRMRAQTSSHEDIAQAEYWLGRTHGALGASDKARDHFAAAARFERTYYGLLARDALGRPPKPIAVAPPPDLSDELIDRVSRQELVAAARLLARVGEDRLLPTFFQAAAHQVKSDQEGIAKATIAWRLGAPQASVRLARLAEGRGFDLGAYGYPVNAMPSFREITPRVDRALVYGLIRQESEFNARAYSGAGARGIMQIMPDTARLIARAHKQRYLPDSLISDPGYNAMLGTAHLHDLIRNYDGSYIMVLVAYNAGPGRVREWVTRLGDPRTEAVDPIDWVEAIPFQETRDYVKKVMTNTYIYRSRLEPHNVRRFTDELARGRKAPMVAIQVADTKAVATSAVARCPAGAPTSIGELIACD